MEFFAVEAPAVAECCRRMAERFTAGASLFVMGEGPQASDAQHVAVEFVHPIIVGKRALPAIALTSDIGVFTGAGNLEPRESFAVPLRALGKPGDIALGICGIGVEPSIRRALADARERGLLTILVSRTHGDGERIADIELRVADADPLIVQEVSETIYHVLWELVHVFFERDDARAAVCIPAASVGRAAVERSARRSPGIHAPKGARRLRAPHRDAGYLRRAYR